ncbi:response regulator transcription factor [Pedobacter ureilyticus]|jgi:DNA-binding response OmpR family regulator|uniref:Response regulator transcription factor n=1 Tax=Pedobacter ureilyticus TaxID=1393051 RepID=A0ABW9J0G2_9SPHI|nr:response regulator [Pedobacter helvus]
MKRIIVVDDDEEVLDTIELVLEIGGYEVEPLTSAEGIHETVNSFNPDLIILDIVLGKIDGRTICNEIKTNPKTKHIPILMMSGLYKADEINTLETPPDDFMPKPFKMDVLLEKIEALISKKAIRHNIN